MGEEMHVRKWIGVCVTLALLLSGEALCAAERERSGGERSNLRTRGQQTEKMNTPGMSSWLRRAPAFESGMR